MTKGNTILSKRAVVIKALAMIVLLIATISNVNAMTITHKNKVMHLDGMIAEGDLERVLESIAREGYPSIIVLNSPGGRVSSAIMIGRFFRDNFLSVLTGKQCNSSCFLIWSGGYERIQGSSKLGLHRPYWKNNFGELAPNKAVEKYNEMRKIVTKYLTEMDVPSSISDLMMNTESGDIVFLDNDLEPPPISRYATAQREWLIAKCEGLNTQELKDYENIMLTDYGKGNRYSDNEYSKLSSGYIEWIKNKSSSVFACEKVAISKLRAKILPSKGRNLFADEEENEE